jgi:hypothetical protein
MRETASGSGQSAEESRAEQSRAKGGVTPLTGSKLGGRNSSIGRIPWMGSYCQGVAVRQDIDIGLFFFSSPPQNAVQMTT